MDETSKQNDIEEGLPQSFPQPGDLPFVDDEPWWLNACTGYTGGRLMPYIEGYRKAAKVLLHHVESTESDQDLVVYPLAFLWRHCLELQLKEIISMHRQLNGEDAGAPHHHLLDKLWEKARAIAIEVEPGVKAQCDVIDGIVKQLAMIDPGSDGFRYPHDKRGNPTLSGLPQRVNLGRLNQVMERAVFFLRCGAYELSRRLECHLEAEAEAGREWEREYHSAYESEVETEFR